MSLNSAGWRRFPPASNSHRFSNIPAHTEAQQHKPFYFYNLEGYHRLLEYFVISGA